MSRVSAVLLMLFTVTLGSEVVDVASVFSTDGFHGSHVFLLPALPPHCTLTFSQPLTVDYYVDVDEVEAALPRNHLLLVSPSLIDVEKASYLIDHQPVNILFTPKVIPSQPAAHSSEGPLNMTLPLHARYRRPGDSLYEVITVPPPLISVVGDKCPSLRPLLATTTFSLPVGQLVDLPLVVIFTLLAVISVTISVIYVAIESSYLWPV